MLVRFIISSVVHRAYLSSKSLMKYILPCNTMGQGWVNFSNYLQRSKLKLDDADLV